VKNDLIYDSNCVWGHVPLKAGGRARPQRALRLRSFFSIKARNAFLKEAVARATGERNGYL
jgi:hypothetical protein